MQSGIAPDGGAFLTDEAQINSIFTPEDLDAEARLMARTLEDFLRKEVVPLSDRIEAQEPGLMPALLRKAGTLGLLSAGIPEIYDGLNLPKSTLALLAERAAVQASFGLSLGIASGVAMLPLLYFGTPEQKQKYLPKLAAGEILGAFALSEANSGSDALAAQTKATLSADGKCYLLNGEKMWTTNGGFADLFTVFAKVNGEQFTAFLVERDTPGLSLGREEHKLGLKGSSTRRVLLENAAVPVENVLGEIGQGHRPALYALNIGRFHIAASALGSAKESLRTAVQYAKQRVQFGKPIAEFGLIRQKLAEMAIRTYLLETMLYRVAGWWDVRFGAIDAAANDAPERYRAASEEYAIECAIVKFFGTEVQDWVVDETLQIHGGFGFSEEFPAARAFRDSRVSRIYEGTNEINRLTVTDQWTKRIQRGRLKLPDISAVKPSEANNTEQADSGVRQIRGTLLQSYRTAYEFTDGNWAEHQEIAALLAEMAAALFALESANLRAEKHSSPIASAIRRVTANNTAAQVMQAARTVYIACGSTEILPTAAVPIADTIALRREIAAVVLERGGYPF